MAERIENQNKKREKFLAEALEAWTSYQATGLNATGEEVDVWLSQLETGGAEAPECHL